MAQEIVQIQTLGDALRNTGYKNIECAVSEIIDNSVQASAKNVLVVIAERLDADTGRKRIDEIAFFDDGSGMDTSILGGCLGIGVTTRMDRSGMGRFGVGLPQASLYACPSIEVYSWQNGYENCHVVKLDINKVKTGEQTVIDDPIKTPIPDKYKTYLSYKILNGDSIDELDFKPAGTLVLWKNCDRVVPKTVRVLFDRLCFALGQKFRYFLNDDGCSIRLIHHENPDLNRDILPNDPLMLLPNNYILGNPNKPGELSRGCDPDFTEPIFKPFADKDHPDGLVVVPIKYHDPEDDSIKESNVEVRFSIVKDIFYDKTAIVGDPGSTALGKHVKSLEGISIVRANREIDFGRFDFYESINKPQHRWWGCEIRFMPELDEAFGVANNKQHVELRRVDPADYQDEEVKPVWQQLYSLISTTISKMYSTNQKTREGSRNVEDVDSPTTKIINSAEEADSDGTKSESEATKEITPERELIEKKKEELESQGVENPTDDEVRSYMNNKVNIKHVNLGKQGPIFDYSFALGSCDVQLNMDHIFYSSFLEQIFNEGTDVKTAFELFICSFTRAVDETNINQSDQNDLLVARWNEKLRRYIEEQKNFAKG